MLKLERAQCPQSLGHDDRVIALFEAEVCLRIRHRVPATGHRQQSCLVLATQLVDSSSTDRPT